MAALTIVLLCAVKRRTNLPHPNRTSFADKLHPTLDHRPF